MGLGAVAWSALAVVETCLLLQALMQRLGQILDDECGHSQDLGKQFACFFCIPCSLARALRSGQLFTWTDSAAQGKIDWSQGKFVLAMSAFGVGARCSRGNPLYGCSP